MLVRRDNREKQFVKLEDLPTAIPAALDDLARALYDRALANREARTAAAATMDEVLALTQKQTGFVKTMWCGELACEEAMKEKAGLSSRCMPFAQEKIGEVCPVCGKPAKTMVVWGGPYKTKNRDHKHGSPGGGPGAFAGGPPPGELFSREWQ